MKILTETLSLCEYCYRHVPALRILKDGQIFLRKKCKWHGEVDRLVEPDAEFYLGYNYENHAPQSYMIDITNRCNLTCPNCYQEPDNQSKDLPISYYLDLISAWPDDGWPIALCGAEPTMRKDLPEFIRSIKSMPGKTREVIVLTNGVRLADENYARQFVGIPDLIWTVGLNDPDYQGSKVRQKQMKGLDNCLSLGLTIKDISYTLDVLDKMEYCLKEMQDFYGVYSDTFRIRAGVEVGRYPGGPKLYLSDLVKEAKRISEKYNWKFEKDDTRGNRAHYAVFINGVPIKIIQWPDAAAIDLKEVQTEGIADAVLGKPKSPIIHNLILRDAFINKGLPLYDTIPTEYLENYGRWQS